MAVFRVERTRDYTVMSNHHLKNKDLSLKAKGLLSQMLSLPENWDYTPPRSTGVPNAAQAAHTAAMTMPIMLTATATACVMAAGVK